MLQQTTVAAVVPYYERFLTRFPTVEALAAAEEQDVLTQWEGLGYYSRARNLHRAAQAVVEQFQGQFPQSVAELLQLPGVGRYTAGAIASFAFDLRAPIVEANTLRLYSRLLGYEGDPRSTAGQKQLWEFAEAILPTLEIGAFNQALIDLGATICTPTNPQCNSCPLVRHCRAFQQGLQNAIPQVAPRPEVTQLYEVAFAIRQGDHWLLRQRASDERWGGLWDFPRLEIEARNWNSSPMAGEPVQHLSHWSGKTGVEAASPVLLPDSSYGFTRYRVQLRRVVASMHGGPTSLPDRFQFVPHSELSERPLTRSSRLFADALQKFRHLWQGDDTPYQLQGTPAVRRRTRRNAAPRT